MESADGSVILSKEIPYSFSSVVISTPEIAVGDTYTITVGETSEEVVIDNSSSNSGFGGGQIFSPEKGGTPPDGMMPGNDEQMPEIPDGTNNGDTHPDFSQEKGNWGGRSNDNEMQRPENDGNMGNTAGENTAPEGSNEDDSFSVENIILLGVSGIILILGCAVAFVFKRR